MSFEEEQEYWSKTFEGKDFSGEEIDSKEFDGCTFVECNFTDATFDHCNFVDCEFKRCNLSVVQIKYSKFSDVIFSDCKAIGINWTTVDWPRMMFSAPIKFYGSIINDSSFFGLPLQDLVIENCTARDVDFREGDFTCANFKSTDFLGAIFSQTTLKSADFTDAANFDIDIFNNKIEKAKFDRLEAINLLDCLDIELVD